MKLKDAFPSRFLKADDFAEPRLLTISKVTAETVKNDDGESTKACLWFEESEQGMIVNKTNWVALVNITGHDDSDDWMGAQVVLAREVVAFGGRMVPAIRVKRPRKPAAAAVAAVEFDDEIP
jgi:hypothetical protein